MIILKPIIVCIAAMLIIIVLRETNPSFVPVIAIMVGIYIFIYCIPYIRAMLYVMESFKNKSSELAMCVNIVIKVVSVSVICKFSSELCCDASENYLAAKIDFIGKIIILTIVMPSVISLIETIIKIIGEL